MEIKILNLKLRNFKGVKELEINFDCKNTNIYGANATGKTTVFDAFKWLFFDKDSNDRKDFNIKTLDSDNNPIHFLEHEVEATLIIDGIDTTFKKVLQEKWVKKRGQTEQEFSGHETNYWIDEVPVKKKDYEEKINSLIPESLFKLITDPSYFNNQLKWTERRELLINISGANISDDEILDSKEEFKIFRKINYLEHENKNDLKNKISKIASTLPIEYTKYFIDILPRDYYIYSFAFVVASNLIKLYKKDRDFALQVLKELINIDLKVNAYKYYQELENLDLVTTDGLKNLTRNIKRRCK